MREQGEQSTWSGKIESLAPDGRGIGSSTAIIEEKTVRRPVFIPYSVPGDILKATITARKGKYLFGEISQLKEPSPHRVAPLCPHYGICGGCNLQHVAYDEQLRQKA